MYKTLKNLVIVLAMSLLTIFTLWDIITYASPLPGGVVESVLVTNSEERLPNQLKKIASSNHILIAKQIIIPSDTPLNGFMGKYVFEKIGSGKLPSIYPEEKNAQVIKNSNNNTNYIIVGSRLSAKSLSSQLNQLGNTTVPVITDTRLSPIQTLNNSYRLPILIILVSFVALLLAEYVSKIKEDGIRRLAGISRIKLAFSSSVRDGKVIVLIFLLLVSGGSLYFMSIQRFWIPYFESLIFTLFLGGTIFFLLGLILSVAVFYVLQNQKLNLSIKGKSPMTVIIILVIFFQLMSIMISLSSITSVINADKQTTLLREAKKGWRDNKQYYAPTLTAGVLSVIQSHPENLKGLLIDLLNQPNVLLASSNSLMIANSEKTWNESVKTYTFPSGLPYTNVMYVNTALVEKGNIQLPTNVKNQIKQLGVGDYAILIPKNQKNNFASLENYWTKMENNLVPYLTKNPTVSLYSSSKPLFGFSVMHNQFNNYSSIPDPLIIVYSAKTFEKGDAKQVAINASSYLSNGQILTTNREMVNQVFEKYHLQNYQGSFFNGYQAVSTNLATQINKRNLLFGVNILCLLSSLLLISLLNSIYLYQNRKTFLLQRLAGKSWLDIHMVYLAVVVMLTAGISIIARLWLHVPNEALIVPVIYLLLVFVLFALQVYREREANVLYLKGL